MELEGTEEISLDKMSILSLTEYCHTATFQVEMEVEKILGALKGVEVTPPAKETKQYGLFNSSVDLADRLVKLKDKVLEVSAYLVS